MPFWWNYAHVWPCMAIHGHAWPYMAIHGHVWPCMAMDGHIWPCMAMQSSKRVSKSKQLYKINETPKSKTSFRCAKLRKNPETKVSRFLAFYPLIWAFQTLSRISNDGVWRDLSFHMKNSWFHALWLGIGPFFVFKSKEIHGNPWKSMEVGVGMAVCLSARSFMWGEVFGMLNKLAVQHIYSRM